MGRNSRRIIGLLIFLVAVILGVVVGTRRASVGDQSGPRQTENGAIGRSSEEPKPWEVAAGELRRALESSPTSLDSGTSGQLARDVIEVLDCMVSVDPDRHARSREQAGQPIGSYASAGASRDRWITAAKRLRESKWIPARASIEPFELTVGRLITRGPMPGTQTSMVLSTGVSPDGGVPEWASRRAVRVRIPGEFVTRDDRRFPGEVTLILAWNQQTQRWVLIAAAVSGSPDGPGAVMPPTSPVVGSMAKNSFGGRRGVTLTEVVISIGVAVLLAALVMPAVSTVKRRAALSTCAAHLGDIGRSLFALQAERGGYGCLAGAITISNAAGRSLPDALDDSARRRYSYLSLPLQPWGPGFVDRLLPLPLVLSPRRTGAATSLAEVLQQAGDAANPGLRRFRCPGVLDGAARDLPTEVITVDGVAHYMGYGVKVDYGINSTVFGFTTNPAVVQARGRGRIPKNGSSRIVLLADRDVDDPGAGVATWATRTSNPATLRDVIQDPGSFAFACKVDVRRHRSRTNVLFCDGHVETVREDNLRNCFIVSP